MNHSFCGKIYVPYRLVDGEYMFTDEHGDTTEDVYEAAGFGTYNEALTNLKTTFDEPDDWGIIEKHILITTGAVKLDCNRYAPEKEAEPVISEEEREIRIHAKHCCKVHGCKYSDENCPVMKDVVKQEYQCDDCYIEEHSEDLQ